MKKQFIPCCITLIAIAPICYGQVIYPGSQGRSQNTLQTVTVTLHHSQILDLTTSKLILPAVAGKTSFVVMATFDWHFPVEYNTNGAVYLIYDSAPPARGGILGIGAPNVNLFAGLEDPEVGGTVPAGWYYTSFFYGGYVPTQSSSIGLVGDRALSGGDAANTLKIKLFYYIE